MSATLENEVRIKELFKEALAESLDDPESLFRKLFDEIREDIGLAKAMEEAKDSPDVSREAVFRILEGKG